MTNYGPADAFLIVSGKNLTSDTFTLDETVEELTEEARPFGGTFDANKGVGVGKIQLEAAGGIYDDRQVGMLAALQEQGTSRQLVAYGTAGTDPGADATMLNGPLVAKWKRMLDKGGLTKAHAEYAMDAAEYMRGRVLHGFDAETTDGDTESASVDEADYATSIAILFSSVDDPTEITTDDPHGLAAGDVILISGHTGSTPSINGTHTIGFVSGADTFTIPVNVTVPGAGGTAKKIGAASGTADLHVPALTLDGHTGLVVRVLGSEDDITFASLVSFTAVTVAGSSERKAISTAIPRYTAIDWDFTGSGGSPDQASAVPFVVLHRA